MTDDAHIRIIEKLQYVDIKDAVLAARMAPEALKARVVRAADTIRPPAVTIQQVGTDFESPSPKPTPRSARTCAWWIRT